MDEKASFIDSLMKKQKEFIDNWLHTTSNMQKAFFSYGLPKEGATGAASGIMNLYNSWLKTVGTSYDELMKMYPSATGKDTLGKLFRSFDSYVKVFEFWSPVLNAMQENALNTEGYQDMFDPEKFKALTESIYGLMGPESASEILKQTSELVETWGKAATNLVNPWVEAYQKNIDIAMDASSAADPNASMNMFHTVYRAFEKTFGKTFKTPQVGKDREKLELILKTMDMYSVYTASSAEFQHKMFVAGEKAMKKVIDKVGAMIKAGEQIKSYNDFYKLWTEITENEYFELFNTEDFSRVQGQLLDSALEFRKYYHKLIELYLVDLPIPVRTEMDDVYKTIHDLKRRVRTLEKLAKKAEAKNEKENEI
ncbi:MAG: hypothetical protein HQL05_10905 [Nitrospirae bacterium]|uniref:poly(R)-hydroxyalkanoic acid synthase subunit PhaE n=1 Tax=Candidatus Magnetobacterium casense TaxID=1455061 RepID=UPI00058BAE2B|nr:poly(R)-hydroxyalkanoic acid synthase subunit PhaE [Candidatus Magnetobacterium casensis]MBF0338329.1 hypothetical protein [Nitrospirota bacterium]